MLVGAKTEVGENALTVAGMTCRGRSPPATTRKTSSPGQTALERSSPETGLPRRAPVTHAKARRDEQGRLQAPRPRQGFLAAGQQQLSLRVKTSGKLGQCNRPRRAWDPRLPAAAARDRTTEMIPSPEASTAPLTEAQSYWRGTNAVQSMLPNFGTCVPRGVLMNPAPQRSPSSTATSTH